MPQIGSLFVNLSMNTAQFAAASNVAVTSLNNIAVNSRKTQFALTNLGFQLNDVVSGLASGQAPMRIFAQQAGQVFQAFTQGGGFRTVGTAILGLITPARLAGAAIAAVGAGFAGLLLRSQSNVEQLRQLNLILERTGRLSSNLDVGSESARLRSLGVTRDIAQQQRLAVARNFQLDPNSAGRLSELGANIGAFTGLGPEAGFKELMSAIQGGPEATIRFAASLGALSTQQAATLVSSARLSGGLKEQNAAIAAITAQMKGLAKEGMNPVESAAAKLAAAWEKLVESMSKSTFVENNRKFFAQQLNEISDFMENGPGGINRKFEFPLPPPPKGALTREQALNILNSKNPTAPTLAQATAALNTIGGQAAVNEGLQAMGMVGPSRGWRTAKEQAETSFSRRLGAGLDEAGPIVVARDPQKALDVADATNKQTEANRRALPILELWNVQQEAAAAAEAKRVEMMEKGATPEEAATAAAEARAFTLAKFNIELGKENTLTGMRIESERKVAKAMLESEGAAIRLGIAEQARLDTLQKGGDLATRTRQGLQQQAARVETGLAQGVVTDRKDIEAAQKRVSLLGESTEYIDRQIALLRVRQTVEAAGVPIAKEVVDARIAGVNALQDELDKLAQQRRIMDQVREIAGVFENAFSSAFDAIGAGTFRVRKFLGDLLKDLGKTLASSTFKRLLGGDDGGGGILGKLVGRLFPSLLGTAAGAAAGIGGPLGDFGHTDLNKYATGGSFRVGGYGAIDSQLVAFRASPGEMIDVSQPGQYSGGSGEVIHINLNPSEGWVSGIADQRIVTRSGQIIDVAVKQSQRTVQRNFAGMSAEAQARTA